MYGPCESCGSEKASFRRATQEYLCPECRKHPNHALVPIKKVALALKLPEQVFSELTVAFAPNPYNPAFHGVRLGYVKEIRKLLEELGYDDFPHILMDKRNSG